ncbi:MAG TPA: hypothetical protein VFM34_07890 [Moraxellaceae bacterium]|nr:hypothetical protein [Moraxellaceae bacterium]
MRTLIEYLFYLAYKSEIRHVRRPAWSDRKPYFTLARLMLSVPLLFNAFTLVVVSLSLAGRPQWLVTPGSLLACALVGFGVTSLTRRYFEDEQRSTAIIQRCQREAGGNESAECTLDLLYYFGSMATFFTTSICVYLQGLGY